MKLILQYSERQMKQYAFFLKTKGYVNESILRYLERGNSNRDIVETIKKFKPHDFDDVVEGCLPTRSKRQPVRINDFNLLRLEEAQKKHQNKYAKMLKDKNFPEFQEKGLNNNNLAYLFKTYNAQKNRN